ncbi:PEP-CTERM sorting domain-containing protein [Roseateles sp.]|uniref:PEP-CTERM sorting domain-containing protein n=1 Tax=Roseateles sp. TaxID=1971397 RepID=UPI0039E87B76
MMIRKSLLALAALAAAGAAHAATYSFTGSFDTDPATSVLTGTFSFDDVVVAAGGSDGSFDLTSLTISFQGQTYTLAQATDPYVQFDGGQLTGPNALFTTPSGGELALQSFWGSSGFTYFVNSTSHIGTLNISAVPEPEGWALMLGGLGAVALIARRRKA